MSTEEDYQPQSIAETETIISGEDSWIFYYYIPHRHRVTIPWLSYDYVPFSFIIHTIKIARHPSPWLVGRSCLVTSSSHRIEQESKCSPLLKIPPGYHGIGIWSSSSLSWRYSIFWLLFPSHFDGFAPLEIKQRPFVFPSLSSQQIFPSAHPFNLAI